MPFRFFHLGIEQNDSSQQRGEARSRAGTASSATRSSSIPVAVGACSSGPPRQRRSLWPQRTAATRKPVTISGHDYDALHPGLRVVDLPDSFSS